MGPVKPGLIFIASLRLPGSERPVKRRLIPVILMKPAAALLIDSSNFYHALMVEGRLPFGSDSFSKLFSELGEEYDLQSIVFYDAAKDISKDPDGYAGQQKFHSGLLNIGWPLKIKTRKLKYVANLRREQVDAKAVQAGIVDACKEKLWDFLSALGVLRLTREKGIDVLLAVDAIEAARSRRYAALIILSGDADFVPAVHLIQRLGVNVVNLHPYSGSSTELRTTCKRHLLIEFDDKGPFIQT